MLPPRSDVAIDATGLRSRHVSSYYMFRQGGRHRTLTYPKLTVVCDLKTHLWLGADVCMGPCVDSPQFPATVRQAVGNQPIKRLLGDKGYDAEHNHVLCREKLGIPVTIIPARRNVNGTRKWPATKYRRQMKRRASRRGYGQRWQVESGFSRHKRVHGDSLRARRWEWQQWECFARVLTHNIKLVAAH
jgi:transposase